jgi:DUF1009 family protein
MALTHSVGLIAGNGQFPILFAKAAKEQGVTVIAVGMDGETEPDIASYVDSYHLVKVGQLGKMIRIFQNASITKAAMAGGVRKTRLFGGARPDWTALKLLAQTAVRKDDGMLRAIAREFESKGIEIIDSTTYMPECLAPEGVLTGHDLDQQALTDLSYGYEVARKIGELDIGQTVIVKAGAVVALEAIEGTDACIKRAGELTERRGGVAVKVAKPEQDMRFDVPAIGVKTIENLATAGITVLGVEAGRTLMLEPQSIIERADALGITIVGLIQT